MKPESPAPPTGDCYIWIRFAKQRWDSAATAFTWDGYEIEPWEPVHYDGSSIDIIGSDEGYAWQGTMQVVHEWKPLLSPEEQPTMRIEELSPEKFYVVIMEGEQLDLEEMNRIYNRFKQEGLKVAVFSDGAIPPRYWGIYDSSAKAWLRKSNGDPHYFPAPGVAQALLDTLKTDMAHTVDGRGRSVSESLQVKEMIYGPSSD